MTSSVEKRFLFNLKLGAKELATYSWRCEKKEKEELVKLKQAVRESNKGEAYIRAENAIRQQKLALHYILLASRVDAAANRIQTFCTTKKVTQSMAGILKSMNFSLKSRNFEKFWSLMDKFENGFEDLDVQSACMENTTSQTTNVTFPVNDLDHLSRQVVEEAGIELDQLPKEGTGALTSTTVTSQEQDELAQRLAKLKQS